MPTKSPAMPGKGQSRQGMLVSDLPLLKGWQWPYIAVTGKEDGPLTTIIAGIHGCEYVSIWAAVRLGRELDPTEVHGRVVVVPVINLPAFRERTPFVTPFDGKNPNRVYPGNPTGTFSDQMAYFVFNTLIKPSDAFIDLHGGDMVEELVPFAGYLEDAGDVSTKSKAMAEAFGLQYTIPRRIQPGAQGGMTYVAGAEHGVPSLLAEAGGIGQLTPSDVALLVDGGQRTLQATGNLPGTPNPPKTTFLSGSNWLYSKHGGFWIAGVKAGDEVTKGQKLGQIYSLLGEPIETIESPSDAVVIFRTTSAAVKENGLLMGLGEA